MIFEARIRSATLARRIHVSATNMKNVKEATAIPTTTLFEADDLSNSSTLCVDCESKQQEGDDCTVLTCSSSFSSGSSRSSQRGKKHVSFDMDGNQEYENNTDMTYEDLHELWYTSKAYRYFKEAALALGKHIIEQEKCNRAPYSYQRVMEHTYEICCQVSTGQNASPLSVLSVNEKKHMIRWAEVAPGRLGLEKWALRKIAKDKTIRRREMVDMVLDLQQCTVTSQEDKDEFIRQSCERISRPSRMFAFCLAQAQAAVFEKQLNFFAE